MTNHPQQYGFDDLLSEAAADNKARVFDRETAHLPETMEAAIRFHREQIDHHHTAMLENDFEAAIAIRKEAHVLARKLDRNGRGILAHDNAPGYVLARETTAASGMVPLWGQDGAFRTQAAGTMLDVSMQGMFGIGSTVMPFLGFEVRAVDQDKPFLSETGYRSFLGVSVAPVPDMDVEHFVRRVVEVYVQQECNGRLVSVAEKFRKSPDQARS